MRGRDTPSLELRVAARFLRARLDSLLRNGRDGFALVLLVLGLIASIFHLGRPSRGWRAASHVASRPGATAGSGATSNTSKAISRP